MARKKKEKKAEKKKNAGKKEGKKIKTVKAKKAGGPVAEKEETLNKKAKKKAEKEKKNLEKSAKKAAKKEKKALKEAGGKKGDKKKAGKEKKTKKQKDKKTGVRQEKAEAPNALPEEKALNPALPTPKDDGRPRRPVFDRSAQYGTKEALKILRSLTDKADVKAFTKGDERVTITRAIPAVMRRFEE